MKIICVSGGSYKSFYINHLVKINSADLLVFNFGLIYDYNVADELLGNGVVTKELMSLSKRLQTKVVAGIFVVTKLHKKKAIILCDGDKIHICSIDLGAKVLLKNHTFVIGDETTNYRNYNKIVLSKSQIKPNLNNCSKRKILVFIDKFGLNLVSNGNLKRNFNKYSKIILK